MKDSRKNPPSNDGARRTGRTPRRAAGRSVGLFLRLEITAGRQEFAGAFRYMNAHAADWRVAVLTGEDAARRIAAGEFDGVICAEDANALAIRDALADDVALATIDVSEGVFPARRHKTAFVSVDNASIGRMAAAHLRKCGRPRSALFVGDERESQWSVARGDAFAGQMGLSNLETARVSATMPTAALGALLGTLPRPIAALAAADRCAVRLLEACRMAGLSLPADLAAVGVDNDELYCRHLSPSLSSVACDFEREAYVAARELDALMASGNKPPARQIVVKPVRVVERQSTSFFPPAKRLVERALAYIDEHVADGIGPGDVARALGVSRRLADLRFSQLQGESIGTAIRRIRLEHLRRTIEETDMPPARAALSCGYADPKYAMRLFRGRYGTTMTRLRRRKEEAVKTLHDTTTR